MVKDNNLIEAMSRVAQREIVRIAPNVGSVLQRDEALTEIVVTEQQLMGA